MQQVEANPDHLPSNTSSFVATTTLAVFPLFLGLLSATFQDPTSKPWYQSLHKPAWTPPSYLFGPVWTILYALMGWSIVLVYRAGVATGQDVFVPMLMFFLQLAVNVTWSPAFFYFKRPDVALAIIVLLWGLIVATIISFFGVSKVAAWMLLPYILWVSYASTLNFYIVLKNQQ